MILEDFIIEKLKNSTFYNENTGNFLNTRKITKNEYEEVRW